MHKLHTPEDFIDAGLSEDDVSSYRRLYNSISESLGIPVKEYKKANEDTILVELSIAELSRIAAKMGMSPAENIDEHIVRKAVRAVRDCLERKTILEEGQSDG